jgi:hypothetical protein
MLFFSGSFGIILLDDPFFIGDIYMNSLQQTLIAAAETHFQAKTAKAAATINVYLNNPVGVGEHPQIVDEFIEAIEAYEAASSGFDVVQKLKEQMVQANESA